MRVDPVSRTNSNYEPEQSDVLQRLQYITQMIGKRRLEGVDEVNFLLRDNPVDNEVIERLSRLYIVDVQRNDGPSVRVKVQFR